MGIRSAGYSDGFSCLFIYLLSIQPELEMKDKASAAVETVQPSPAPAVPAVPAQTIDETDTLQTTFYRDSRGGYLIRSTF